jgi:hypothetical protein
MSAFKIIVSFYRGVIFFISAYTSGFVKKDDTSFDKFKCTLHHLPHYKRLLLYTK